MAKKVSRYALYGLQDKRTATEGEGEAERPTCMWCDNSIERIHNSRGRNFNMCFAGFVICEACLDHAYAAMMGEGKALWTIGDCFKCRQKQKIGYLASRCANGGFAQLPLCTDCIKWGHELVHKPPPPPPPGTQFKLF